MAIGALDTVARRASVWHPRDTRRHGALPLAAPAGRIHLEDRVVLGIGQPGEVPVHVASAGLAIGRDDGDLLVPRPASGGAWWSCRLMSAGGVHQPGWLPPRGCSQV